MFSDVIVTTTGFLNKISKSQIVFSIKERGYSISGSKIWPNDLMQAILFIYSSGIKYFSK